MDIKWFMDKSAIYRTSWYESGWLSVYP